MTDKMTRFLLAATGVAAAVLLPGGRFGPGQASAAGPDAAEYVLTFTGSWTAKTHPFEYPPATSSGGPHLSGLIGATHDGTYAIYREGTPPTPGLEKLSEEGKHVPLDQEIKRAVASGAAGALIETGPIRDFSQAQTVRFKVDARHPMVSAVAMIAPSPDWFAGVANVSLMEDGRWVAKKTVELFAYDSGGDDGTTYKASDKDTNPKKPTTMAATPHFVIKGRRPAVATLTFVKE